MKKLFRNAIRRWRFEDAIEFITKRVHYKYKKLRQISDKSQNLPKFYCLLWASVTPQ